MQFVDLFCGIGGFHEALRRISGDFSCVFQSEIDEQCKIMYQKNFGKIPQGDIRDHKYNIPRGFELLTAGFPCQAFSKAGNQLGFEDLTRGTLFKEIMDVIKEYLPAFVLLENVRNLETHDNGKTFAIINKSLIEEGYEVYSQILSPDQFGIPQNRKRIFIIGINKNKIPNFSDFEWPNVDLCEKTDLNVKSLQDSSAGIDMGRYGVSEIQKGVFNHWSKFMKCLPKEVTPPSPTWSMEFGRNYPLEGIHPIKEQTPEVLCDVLRREGYKISPTTPRLEIEAKFPPYIRSMDKPLPQWKILFIKNNRKFWKDYGNKMPRYWLRKTRKFKETYQKFEWHVGSDASRNVMDHMIHTRPSGIRVSRLNRIPALVAISQIPIIGPWGRKLTPREAANAQSFGQDFKLHDNDAVAYRQLGNSVNVVVVEEIIRKLIELRFQNNNMKTQQSQREDTIYSDFSE